MAQAYRDALERTVQDLKSRYHPAALSTRSTLADHCRPGAMSDDYTLRRAFSTKSKLLTEVSMRHSIHLAVASPADSRPPQNCRPPNSHPTTSKSTNASPTSSRTEPIHTNEPADCTRFRNSSTSRATMLLKRQLASIPFCARS